MARVPGIDTGWGALPGAMREAEAALLARWETFQSAGEIAAEVRPEIAASWRRSTHTGIAPDWSRAPVDATALREFDESGPSRRRFLASASELTRRLVADLGDAPAVAVVCDDFGLVLQRAGSSAALRSADEVNLVPGAMWSEHAVGTTAIGLALAAGESAHVFAAEHFAEALHGFSGAAAVVRQPAMHEALGALGLVTSTSISPAFSHALIVQLALEVERRLESQLVGPERELLEHHLRDGAGSSTPALTVDRGGHTVIQNARMLQSASGEDVQLLLSLARRALQGDAEVSEQLELSLGSCRAEVRIAHRGIDVLGAVVSLTELDSGQPHQPSFAALAWPAMIGRSAAMRQLLREAGRVARRRMNVAIWGEPGTGKLMLAQHLHRSSGGESLTVVHCASEEWERELEQAKHGDGTIVLRRVHALTPSAQLRLCDHLDEIAEANPELWVISLLGALAAPPDAELLSRLARVSLAVPPLRDRGHDLRLLVDSWCEEHAWTTGVRPMLRPEAIDVLEAHSWPGNVRELNNALDAASLRGGTVIGVEALALAPDPGVSRGGGGRSLRELEREAIETALRRTGGNVSRAARELGIGRATLNRRLRSYRLLAGVPEVEN